MVFRKHYSWVSLFNGKLTFVGYSKPKPSLKKDKRATISPIIGENKRVHHIPNSISSKVNVMM